MEDWKDIKGYEGIYQISNMGRVKSLARDIVRSDGVVTRLNETILKQSKDGCGYSIVRTCKDYQKSCIKPHKIVAEYFIEKPTGKCEVNHINGNKDDNRAANLEWSTRSENMKHAYNMNLHAKPIGAKNGRAKLDDSKVSSIKKLLKNGINRTVIAAKYNVSKATIDQIAVGRSWAHVK